MAVVDLPRRWRWAVLAGCGVVALLALMFVLLMRSATRQADTSDARAASMASVGASSPIPTPTSPPPAATASGRDEVEVCGAGWLPAAPDGLSPDPSALQQAVESAGDNILALMRSDSSEWVKASAELLDAFDLDTLARAAVSSQDPAIYALAFRECYGRGQGACQLLGARRWAQLDPDNASPWVYLFSDAVARKDFGAQEEALYRIGAARYSRSGGTTVASAVLDAAPDDDTSRLVSSMMMDSAFGIEAAVVRPSDREIVAACSGDALKDANRAQACDAAAEQFAERSDDMLERQMGIRIGRQVGWSADRADRLQGEILAFEDAQLQWRRVFDGLDCADVDRRLDAARQYVLLGASAGVRAWVAGSGKSARDFIELERARRLASVDRH